MILARNVPPAHRSSRSRVSYEQSVEADREIVQLTRRAKSRGYWTARLDLIDLFEDSESMTEDNMLPATFARARRLLDTIPSGFPVPDIGLDPDGEVAFDWIRPDRTMVSVSIGSEGDPSYAAGLVDGTAYGFLHWDDRFPVALTDLLRRLYHPA